MLHPPGEPYSVWFFFEPDGAFRLWYVNLEVPAARWDDGGAAGVDTVDHDLDVVARPDGSWRWKDEGEFAEHLAHPDTYWVDDAEAVWAAGRRAVALIEAGAFPFDGTFTDVRPDPAWTAAELPSGWDRPRAYG
jgi:predicted RNA-binding protein associated with RNAse of E/G family